MVLLLVPRPPEPVPSRTLRLAYMRSRLPPWKRLRGTAPLGEVESTDAKIALLRQAVSIPTSIRAPLSCGSKTAKQVQVQQMREERFDMVVVGAPTAGEKAKAKAAYFGKSVAIVGPAPALGGAMAASAVTTKAMREAALYLTGFQRRHVYGAGIDLHPAGRDRPVAGPGCRRLRVDEPGRWAGDLTRHGIELVTGRARLGQDRTVLVSDASGTSTRTLAAGVVLVAPGSRPFHPPGIPFDDPDVLDSESAGGFSTGPCAVSSWSEVGPWRANHVDLSSWRSGPR